MKIGRNKPCPCGSGKKFRKCCEKKLTQTPRKVIVGGILFLLLFAGGVVAVILSATRPAPPGRVWSEEHGHWHDAQRREPAPPPGYTIPGKVWSVEHGHWHDAQPPGPAPPGKVWSPEHAHWHDTPEQMSIPPEK